MSTALVNDHRHVDAARTPALPRRRLPDDTSAEGAGVRCSGVRKVFADETVALESVDLDCPMGAVTVLLGPSGCGKTTLLRCIAGLETIDAGSIFLGDRDVTQVDAGRRGVAMVFQHYGLYPNKSVRGNIEFPLTMAKVPRGERRRRTLAMAELLQLEELLGRRPSQLSGGQRQRVGIGRALVREPEVTLLDEPLSNLDAELRVAMRAELRTLQRRLDLTMVYVTHDQAEALALADLLVVMRSGRIEQAGPPELVFRKPGTSYVGSFLGAMNLIAVPPVLAATALGHEFGQIGVRPEDLHLGSPAEGSAGLVVHGIVTLCELLGSERLVHLNVDGTTVKARVHADTPVSIGMPAEVWARQHALHWFDSNGRRVEASPAAPEVIVIERTR